MLRHLPQLSDGFWELKCKVIVQISFYDFFSVELVPWTAAIFFKILGYDLMDFYDSSLVVQSQVLKREVA